MRRRHDRSLMCQPPGETEQGCTEEQQQRLVKLQEFSKPLHASKTFIGAWWRCITPASRRFAMSSSSSPVGESTNTGSGSSPSRMAKSARTCDGSQLKAQWPQQGMTGGKEFGRNQSFPIGPAGEEVAVGGQHAMLVTVKFPGRRPGLAATKQSAYRGGRVKPGACQRCSSSLATSFEAHNRKPGKCFKPIFQL